MVVLALDCATKTGWAVFSNGTLMESGVQDFTPKRGESAGMRFLFFRRWLQDLVLTIKPNVLAYEMAHHRGGAATEICVGMITRVQEIAAEQKIEHVSVHSGTIKKHIAGGGKADKSEVKKNVEAKYSIKIIDDNHADAIAIADYVSSVIPEMTVTVVGEAQAAHPLGGLITSMDAYIRNNQ